MDELIYWTIDWLRRPYLSVKRFRLYLWAGSWSWWDNQDCACHALALYVGPFGLEVQSTEDLLDDKAH